MSAVISSISLQQYVSRLLSLFKNYKHHWKRPYLQSELFVPPRVEGLRPHRGRSDELCWDSRGDAVPLVSPLLPLEAQAKAAERKMGLGGFRLGSVLFLHLTNTGTASCCKA